MALFLLIPAQSDDALGLELASLVSCSASLRLLNWPAHLPPERTYRQWFSTAKLPVILLVGPTILAGAGLLIESLGGSTGSLRLPVAVVAAIEILR